MKRVASGPSGRGLVAVDLNGDNYPDLAAASRSDNEVVVRWNAGDGTFPTFTRLAAGSNPNDVAAKDVNGDGLPDLITANESNSISVFLATPGGAFAPEQRFSTSTFLGTFRDLTPQQLGLADLTGDDQLDVAIYSTSPVDMFAYLPGNGDGTFGASRGITGGPTPSSLAVGDVNGDGFFDLVGTAPFNNVAFWPGNGVGGFGPSMSLQFGDLDSVIVADLNGDEIPDIAGSGGGFTGTLVRLGTGGGTFSASNQVSDRGGNLAAADIDRDGLLDLLVIESRSTINVLRGRGDGTYDDPASYLVGDETSINAIAVADVDIDGAPDVMVASTRGRIVPILNRGDGRLEQATEDVPAADVFGNSIEEAALKIADFDTDGVPDVFVDISQRSAQIAFGRADGQFREAVQVSRPTTRSNLTLGQFAGDAELDFAFLASNGEVGAQLGLGGGLFGAEVRSTPDAAGDTFGTLVKTEDFNADGIDDLVAVVDNDPKLLKIMLGAGDGTFTTSHEVLQGPGQEQIDVGSALLVDDFNDDGSLDMALTATSIVPQLDDVLLIMLGNGDGTFTDPLVTPFVSRSATLVSGDFNEDGELDLVARTDATLADALVFLAGNGDGTFAPFVPIAPSANGARFLTVTADDFDADGSLDLVYAVSAENSTEDAFGVFFARGLGDGSFAQSQKISARTNFLSDQVADQFATLDMDGNGSVDLAMLYPLVNTVGTVLNVIPVDADNDGLEDVREPNSCPYLLDADSDDDGIADGSEDVNSNAVRDPGETDPCDADSDGDGLQDGTEKGLTSGVPDPDGSGPATGTDSALFVPDADPTTTTDPANSDTDCDGASDGDEDTNGNGAVDGNESDPADPLSVPTTPVPIPPLAVLLAGAAFVLIARRAARTTNRA
ncbi:MAG: FG-GAP-like repeat-containing protein [Pseudomonadota bacterium]